MDLQVHFDIVSHTSAIVLCFHALLLTASSAQHAAPDLLQKDGFDVRQNELQDQGFWKLQDAISSPEENGRFSKRLSASSFSFSRGKKDQSYPGDVDDLISSPIRRLSASEFFGARGRRAPPEGFFGSRGKRLLNGDDDEEMDLSKRQPPKGFVVVRGKRLSPSGFFGSRGKKDSALPIGFFGSRGKKYALSPFGFQGTRGKRPSELDQMPPDKKASLPKGFFGSRGRRSGAMEQLMAEHSKPHSNMDKIGNSLVNRWRYLVKPTNNLEDIFSKRQPSAGFYPLRG